MSDAAGTQRESFSVRISSAALEQIESEESVKYVVSWGYGCVWRATPRARLAASFAPRCAAGSLCLRARVS